MAGGVCVLRYEGEIDAFTAPDLRERLHEAIENGNDVAVLVIDLRAVTFLDSTILGALAGGLRRMRERGGELRVGYPPHPAARIFELTGLDKVFPAATAAELDAA